MRRFGMFRSALLVLVLAHVLALASCVPAGEDSDPRGALGITTEPSPGSRGEPFITADGWTVHVEELVILAGIVGAAIDTASADDNRETAYEGPYLFKASRSESFLARGLPAGPGRAALNFNSLYIGAGYAMPELVGGPRGVDPSLSARFFQRADDVNRNFYDPDAPEPGPAILLVVRAEKGDRTVRIDFGFRGAIRTPEIPLEIRANALNAARVTTVAENLFKGVMEYQVTCNGLRPELPESNPSTDRPIFDDLASADTDGDGVLSPAELRHVRTPACECCSPEVKKSLELYDSISMAELLSERSRRLFVPAAP